jgi:phage tail sheath gpL-like
MIAPSAASRVCGVDVEFKNFNSGKAAMLPQRLAVIGVGNDDADYSLEKYEIPGIASKVGDRYGYGSPLHLIAKILFPASGSAANFPVTIYPLQKAAGAVAATAQITTDGTATKNGGGTVYIGGIAVDFSIAKDDTDVIAAQKIASAINANLDVPAMASATEKAITLAAKWSGAISNLITLEISGEFPGITIGTVAFSGGTLDPNIDPALAKIGIVWETMVLNSFDYKDTSRLDKYYEFGDGRWGSIEKKGLLVAHGCTDNLETRTAVSDIRQTDYINFLIVSVGSRELPFTVGAKGLVNDIMTTANNNPPQDYKGLLTSLHTGSDDAQENQTQRESSVQKGSSTNIKNGSVAELNDIITFWHPANEGPFPSRRYVCDMVKLQNIVFNVRLIMEADALKGAPIVADDQPTVNKTAISPKVIKASLMNLADSLALNAILATAEFTKRNLIVALDSANPKRINNTFPVKLSGNLEISDTLVQFGFLLGGE